MTTHTSGRPRRACEICKRQKIRCSGEKPTCERCCRLNHSCVYQYGRAHGGSKRKSHQGLNTGANGSLPFESHPSSQTERLTSDISGARRVNQVVESTMVLRQPVLERPYELGVPGSLVVKLIDVYFENIYNASLLLHKGHFLETLAAGVARPHVVLSVCALAANYYRDKSGHSTLKDHGFMIEWAQRAGRVVFSDVESFHDDNLVTFVNLSLFWHSQGSWRTFYLYKGNSLNLLVILGLRPRLQPHGDPWEDELRRRRLWACYLMHCQNSESVSRFPVAGMEDLELPWPEEDFNGMVNQYSGLPITLRSGECSGSIWSKIIRAMTLWSSVVSFIKSHDPDLNTKVARIQVLDEEISQWWRSMPDGLLLTPSSIANVQKDQLPNILLLNVVYHQSLCALHSSIVPLFSWGEGDASCATARQISAQEAYEHACAISELFDAILSGYDGVSAMPSFVAYAAYCGCAIQIPFMRSTDYSIEKRARANVGANMKLMQIMASYWRFACLLRAYCRRLLDRHLSSRTVLESEPRFVDIEKLTSFEGNSPYTRASILESIGMLHSGEHGYSLPGSEMPALGTDQHSGEINLVTSDLSIHNHSQDIASTQNRSDLSGKDGSEGCSMSAGTTLPLPLQSPHQFLEQGKIPPQCRQEETCSQILANQTLDIFHADNSPEFLDPFPDDHMPDLSLFDPSSLNLDWHNLDLLENAGHFTMEY